MPKADGVIDLALEEVEDPDGNKGWVLSLDVVAGKDDLWDLKDRLKAALDQWLTDRGIMIAHGEGPDGCKYGKPN